MAGRRTRPGRWFFATVARETRCRGKARLRNRRNRERGGRRGGERGARVAVAMPALPEGPKLEPLSFHPGTAPPHLPPPPGPRPRARRRPPRHRPDPNFCLNHETVSSQKTCAACEE